MTNSYKLITLMSLCFASADIIKEKILPPLNPPNIIERDIPLNTISELSQKPVFDETTPTVRDESGIRRVISIPPEIDANAVDYKGNISILAEIDGKPCDNARVDIFSLTAKIRRPRFVGGGDSIPIPPYPDVVAKRAETYYTGRDGRLEVDMPPGNYMLVILKDNWGGRSDAFSVMKESQEFTIKMVKFQ
jgi:hypothetical protein